MQITSDPGLKSDCIAPPKFSSDLSGKVDPPDLVTPLLALYNYRTQSGYLSADLLANEIDRQYSDDEHGRMFGTFPSGEAMFDTAYFHMSLHPNFDLTLMPDEFRSREAAAAVAPLHWTLSVASRKSISTTFSSCGPYVMDNLKKMLEIGMYIRRDG